MIPAVSEKIHKSKEGLIYGRIYASDGKRYQAV